MDAPADWEVQFYGIVREYIIFMIILLGFCMVSFVGLKQYLDRQTTHIGASFLICVVCLSAVWASLVLLPVTTLANEVILRFHGSEWLPWLNTNLLSMLWSSVYFLTNGALFILLPFAYFYYETEDLQHRRWFSKTFETLKVLVLVDALMYGFTKLVQFLLSLNSAHGFAALNAMACGMGALVILQTLPSGFVALFEFARSLNVDIIETLDDEENKLKFELQTEERRLEYLRNHTRRQATGTSSGNGYANGTGVGSARRSSGSTNSHHLYHNHYQLPSSAGGIGVTRRLITEEGVDDIPVYTMEAAASGAETAPSSQSLVRSASRQSLLVKLVRKSTQILSTPTLTDDSEWHMVADTETQTTTAEERVMMATVLGLRTQLYDISMRRNYARKSPLLRKVTWLFCIVFNLFSWTALMAQLAVNLFLGVWSLVIQDNWNTMPLQGRSEASGLGLLWALMEVTVFVYVFLAAMVGIYRMPNLRWLQPRIDQTSMLEIFGNLGLLLLISTALPFVVSICRLASFDAMGPLQGVYFFTGRKIVAVLFTAALLARSLWHLRPW